MRAIRPVVILIALLAACRTPPGAPNPTETVSFAPIPAEPGEQTAVATPWPTWPAYVWSYDGPTEIAGVTPTLPGPTTTATATPPAPPPPEPATQTTTPPCVPVQPPGWQSYVVQPGDTVGRLAQCTASSVAAIMAANCLADPSIIFAGTRIFLPQLCVPGTTPTPTPTLGPRDIDSPPSGTTEPPSGYGQVAVHYRQIGQQREIFISFANIVANSLLLVTIQPGIDGQVTTQQVCINVDGTATTGYQIPEGFFGNVYINAIISRDEALRLTNCPGSGPLGQTGGDKAQLTYRLPTPTATPGATETSTPTATFEPSPTAEPSPTVEPTSTIEPTVTVGFTPTVQTEANP